MLLVSCKAKLAAKNHSQKIARKLTVLKLCVVYHSNLRLKRRYVEEWTIDEHPQMWCGLLLPAQDAFHEQL
jgi:hypothetical protein